jgi:N-acetylglucosamine-6-phosphate deacetylase
VGRNLRVIAEALEAEPELREAVPGVHLEGPFISAVDGPRGAHELRFVRDPDWAELASWLEAAPGLVRLVTLAPELPGALEVIRRATAAGIRIGLGHTAASAEVIAGAVRAGACLSTHLGNGSHAVLPRLRNYIWEQLACDDLSASIITDGFHLPDSVIRTFWRAKGPRRIILTSDVTLLGGNPPGVYRWGGIDVEVFPDGHLGLAGTEYLAGAAHLLDWDVPRCVAAAGCTLAEAVAACTVNPAGLFALEAGPPRIEAGAAANLVQFRWSTGEPRLLIERTIRGGREVYRA